MESGLDIVSLPSHTSHALQSLDIVYFKPFKTAFRKLRDMWSLTNKNRVVDKQTLYEWTSQSLEVALTLNSIKAGFKGAGIWPLDRQAARDLMKPSQGFQHVESTGAEGDATAPVGHGGNLVTSSTGHTVLRGITVTALAG